MHATTKLRGLLGCNHYQAETATSFDLMHMISLIVPAHGSGISSPSPIFKLHDIPMSYEVNKIYIGGSFLPDLFTTVSGSRSTSTKLQPIVYMIVHHLG